MRVFIWPQFPQVERGEGGVRRVVDLQKKILPQFGIEIVDDVKRADLVNIHASNIFQTDLPVVFSLHGLHWRGFEWDRWQLQANRILVDMMVSFDKVTVPSEFMANAIRRGLLIDPVVCRNGIEIEKWNVGEKSKPYVLWAKNRVDSVCNPTVVNKLAQMIPSVQFVSTFGNPAQNVTIIGRQTHEQIKPYIQNASIYLATTLETGAITMLEAMASGAVPVGWCWGVNPEIVTRQENGFLVSVGDYDGLVEGIDYCLRNFDRMSQAARQTVLENYDATQLMRNYVDVYEQVLQPQITPTVSIVVTCYNLARYLPACLQSIQQQDFTDWEAIVVDDCSNDETSEIAQQFARNDQRIKVIRTPYNLYLSDARNAGVHASHGRYLLMLDADDRLAKGALRAMVDVLDKNRHIHIVSGRMSVYIESENREWPSDWPPPNPSLYEQLKRRNQLLYASMFRREVFERTGGYRRRMLSAEDAEFWTRALSFGFRAVRIPEITLLYTSRSNSMSKMIQEPDWTSWFTWSRLLDLIPPGGMTAPDASTRTMAFPTYEPVVSVVILCMMGQEILLQDCLDSLVAQTLVEWEAIVVNHSGYRWLDDAGQLEYHYLSGFPFVRLVDYEDGLSLSQARNKGLEQAHTCYVVPLDAGDYLQPTALEQLVQHVDEQGGWYYANWFDRRNVLHVAEQPTLAGIYATDDLRAIGGFCDDIPSRSAPQLHRRLEQRGVQGHRIEHGLFTLRDSYF